MDAYGIGNALKGAFEVYKRMSRSTGRTLALIEELKDGDTLVVTNRHEGDRVTRICRERGIAIFYTVIDPRCPDLLLDLPKWRIRAVFDHTWVEEYYTDQIECMVQRLDDLQNAVTKCEREPIKTRFVQAERERWLGC